MERIQDFRIVSFNRNIHFDRFKEKSSILTDRYDLEFEFDLYSDDLVPYMMDHGFIGLYIEGDDIGISFSFSSIASDKNIDILVFNSSEKYLYDYGFFNLPNTKESVLYSFILEKLFVFLDELKNIGDILIPDFYKSSLVSTKNEFLNYTYIKISFNNFFLAIIDYKGIRSFFFLNNEDFIEHSINRFIYENI